MKNVFSAKIIKLGLLFILCMGDKAETQTITLESSEGWLIYTHGGKRGHRYGPSVIINADKTIYMWLASTGFS
jgi:hypothetical protein